MCDLSVSNLDGDMAHAILSSALADASVVTTVTVGAGEQHQPHRFWYAYPWPLLQESRSRLLVSCSSLPWPCDARC